MPKAKSRIKKQKRSRDAKGKFTSRMSWGERLFILIILLGSMVWSYINYLNRSIPCECGVSEPEIRETGEELPLQDASDSAELAYTPPSHVVEAMNKKPGLMTEIKERWSDDWTMAAELIYRESSFNPQAINPTSGACGLAQSLPCEKMACDLDDVDCQLNWQYEYITERYGDMETALWHSSYYGWY